MKPIKAGFDALAGFSNVGDPRNAICPMCGEEADREVIEAIGECEKCEHVRADVQERDEYPQESGDCYEDFINQGR